MLIGEADLDIWDSFLEAEALVRVKMLLSTWPALSALASNVISIRMPATCKRDARICRTRKRRRRRGRKAKAEHTKGTAQGREREWKGGGV